MTVMITYPHPNVVSHNFSWSLLRTAQEHPDLIHSVFPVRGYSADLSGARNRAMQEFLDSDADHLWTLDTDIGFRADTLPRLLDRDVPVNCANYNVIVEVGSDGMGGPEGTTIIPVSMYREQRGHKGYRSYADMSGFMQVQATGGGCMLIRRDVAEIVQKEYGNNWYSLVSPWGNDITAGEDFSFCWRLEQCDIPIMCDTEIPLTHHKEQWI